MSDEDYPVKPGKMSEPSKKTSRNEPTDEDQQLTVGLPVYQPNVPVYQPNLEQPPMGYQPNLEQPPIGYQPNAEQPLPVY